MRKMMFYLTAFLCVSCAKVNTPDERAGESGGRLGNLSVRMEYESLSTRSQQEDYVPALDSEKIEKKVDVFVFDKNTGMLAAYKSMTAVSQDCTFSMPVGAKSVYAVVNGPDMSSVKSISQLENIVYDMEQHNLSDAGFFMVGHEDCDVVADQTVTPTITVRRLAARVVLRSVSCHIPSQYADMTVNSVFLGNAYSLQTVAGEVDGMQNVNGYVSGNSTPIGKSGVTGACPDYFYRSANDVIDVNSTHEEMYYMYCQPNDTDNFTCLYLLVTIGDKQYYYRVPLSYGLRANVTCSVDVDIINLGSLLPPDGTVQKGDITAVIKVSDWLRGEEYDIKF